MQSIGSVRRRGGGYFAGNPSGQRKYYGIKNSIAFAKQFPLSQYSYLPIQRGSQASLDTYGASFKTATEAQKQARRNNMMRGRGLYRGRGGFFGGLAGLLTGKGWKAGSDAGDAMWEAGGKNLAGFIPGLSQAVALGDMAAPAGQAIASHYGKGLYKGRGAYATNNLVMDGGATASSVVPQFNPSDLHEIVYSNREYVRDIFAPGASNAQSTSPFSLQQWSLNPGLADSFPWLSQLAINFEEYEIMQLAYTYKSTVADFASSSGQVGQVVMCTQYNPNADPFADKEEMMLYEGGMSCKTTESLIHGVECDPKKIAGAASKYVRVGALPPTEDLKNYDLGKTALAVLNTPATYAGQQIGELWVSYTVRLRKPKFASGNAYNVRRDLFASTNVSIPSTTVVTPDITASSLLIGARNSLGCILTPSTDSSLRCATGAGTDDLTFLNPGTSNPTIPYPLSFTLTIPPSYAGCLRIRVLYNVLAGIQNTCRVISLAPNNIFRFKDIPRTNVFGTKTTSHIVNSRTDVETEAGTTQADLELHIRVQPSSNGLPNVIQFSANPGFVSQATTILYPLIEITQFNSFLSIQDDGRSDAVSWVTPAGAAAYWN